MLLISVLRVAMEIVLVVRQVVEVEKKMEMENQFVGTINIVTEIT